MSRYDRVKSIRDNKITRLGSAEFPIIEEKNTDILLIATEGDRCDLISQAYYGSPEYWWFIASANKLSSNNIPAGTQLRIPVSLEQAKLR